MVRFVMFKTYLKPKMTKKKIPLLCLEEERAVKSKESQTPGQIIKIALDWAAIVFFNIYVHIFRNNAQIKWVFYVYIEVYSFF